MARARAQVRRTYTTPVFRGHPSPHHPQRVVVGTAAPGAPQTPGIVLKHVGALGREGLVENPVDLVKSLEGCVVVGERSGTKRCEAEWSGAEQRKGRRASESKTGIEWTPLPEGGCGCVVWSARGEDVRAGLRGKSGGGKRGERGQVAK